MAEAGVPKAKGRRGTSKHATAKKRHGRGPWVMSKEAPAEMCESDARTFTKRPAESSCSTHNSTRI